MRKIIFIILFINYTAIANEDSLIVSELNNSIITTDSILHNSSQNIEEYENQEAKILKKENIVAWRLEELNKKTQMNLSYNEKVQVYIDRYLGRDKRLISKMKGLAPYYFPLFEHQLKKYDLPLEFKYLAIVESALNPKARSRSGATGLWQFMYPTGNQYGLQVTSYVDERKNPLKSTISACEYFVALYDIFSDWNLVLAAYNGGPGYIKGKIKSSGTSDFWELYPYLRTETRNFIPKFIAVNYAMNYADEYEINTEPPAINLNETDTITLKNQTELKALTELLCVNSSTINYLNPSYVKEIYPKNAILVLPKDAVNDFKLNETANYIFIDAVEKKEILIDEDRIVYKVNKGDYLGKIAKSYNVYVSQIIEWNNLKSSDLYIGDKLVVYVKKEVKTDVVKSFSNKNEYIIKKGDTLWEIAKKYKGLSVSKIKSLNNLDSNNLKPGDRIILPSSL